MRLGDIHLVGAVSLFSMRHSALVGPLFVVVGYGLIVGIAFVHFTKFLSRNSPVHWLLSIFLVVELLLQYSLAIWSDPGFVEHEHLVHRDQRICRFCEAVKPYRAHHCRECRRCVYEMDHHCPWINNCVGYYNYRHFWLLLMYIWVSCLYVAMLSAGLFVATFTTSSEDDEAAARDHVVLDRFKVLFSFMATSVVGVVVCAYWGWHVYLVLTEQSTIEFMQRVGEWIRPSVSIASVRHALGRILGRQDALWFSAFILPPRERRMPPKYVLKPKSDGGSAAGAV